MVDATGRRATFAAGQGLINSVLTGTPGSLKILFSDTGFFHTGVRPGSEDPGLHGLDDFRVPFSLTARGSTKPLAIDGAFKVPGLRNVEFTGPYFQNGGQATLEQVVDFYARGGDFPDSSNLPVEIIAVPLKPAERADLVAFLKSLSDDRVRFERAPFDHPEICVPIGYPDMPSADPAFPLSAVDHLIEERPVLAQIAAGVVQHEVALRVDAHLVGAGEVQPVQAVIAVAHPRTVIDALPHRFAVFAVTGHIDADASLTPHNVGDGRPQLFLKPALVHRLARLARAVRLDQIVRARQAADMAGQNVIGAGPHDPPFR